MKESFTNIMSDFSTKLTLRFLIVSIAFIPSIAIYRYFIDYYNEENDFILAMEAKLFSAKKTYTIYAKNADSTESTIYYKFGSGVAEASGDDLVIEHEGINGALENAFSVANNEDSFGIIQEDTLMHAEFLRDNLKQISPLYMERLHILYRCEEKKHESCPDILSKESAESATNKTTKSGQDYIEEAIKDKQRFSAGPSGSGARLLLPYLATYFGIAQENLKNIAYLSSDDMVTKLKEGNLDAAMFMAGTSDDLLETVNAEKGIHLLGISPVDISEMRKKYDWPFRATDFEDEYEKYPYLPTIGVYAVLICSNDVTDSEIGVFLTLLDKIRPKALDEVIDHPKLSLDGDKEYYTSRGQTQNWGIWKSLIIFLISVTLTTVTASSVLQWIISSSKQALYFRRMMKVYRSTTRQNQRSSNSNPELPLHLLKAVNYTTGIHDLFKITDQIRDDYETGGMTMSHYNYLLDNGRNMHAMFQDSLVQKLTAHIQVTQEQAAKASLRQQIDTWFSDGYLSIMAYQFLLDNLVEPN